MRLADTTQPSILRFDEWTLNGIVVVVLCILVITGMVVILVHRLLEQRKAESDADNSVTRPVLALLLVGTVTILATASLSLAADDQARSLLIGGVVSLSSTAVAFYFSSKAASEARQDLLKATTGLPVPDLRGKTLADAHKLISKTGLILDPGPEADPNAAVRSQNPPAGATVPAGTVLKVTSGGGGETPKKSKPEPGKGDTGGHPGGEPAPKPKPGAAGPEDAAEAGDAPNTGSAADTPTRGEGRSRRPSTGRGRGAEPGQDGPESEQSGEKPPGPK